MLYFKLNIYGWATGFIEKFCMHLWEGYNHGNRQNRREIKSEEIINAKTVIAFLLALFLVVLRNKWILLISTNPRVILPLNFYPLANILLIVGLRLLRTINYAV